MGYGLQINNDNFETVISSDYRNYQLHESGNVSHTNGGGTTNYFTTVSFSQPVAKPPLVLFQPSTSAYSCISSYVKSGGLFTGFNYSVQRNIGGSGYSASSNWKSACLPESASGDTYGMQVFDDSGDIVFDSGRSNFNIFDVRTISSVTITAGEINIYHPLIANPYYILAPVGFGVQYVSPPCPGQGGITFARAMLKKVDAYNVKLSYAPIYSGVFGCGAGSGANQSQTVFKVVICDILS